MSLTQPVASMPHSVDAEKGFLCSLATNPVIFDEAGQLHPDLFYIPAHRIIFEHLLDNFQDNNTTDFIIVRDSFRLTELGDIGGIQYLAEIYNFVPSSANWRFYLERMIDHYQRRVTIQAANLLIQRCMDIHLESSTPVRDMCEKGLLAIALSNSLTKEELFRDLVQGAAAAVAARRIGERQFIEISGIRALDLCLGGMLPGEQLVIGAETSYGKTSLALQMACHVALGNQHKKVVVFSMEMNRQTLAERVIASQAGIRMRAVRCGELTDQETEKMNTFVRGVPGARTIVVEDAYNLDISGIISRCRKLKATGELDVVIVDYLQLVSPAIVRDSSRQREVADISRRLKVLAGELGVVVIALSQLNEEGKLRESRAIGQDADVVLVIREPKDSSDTFEREISIEKSRNGPRGGKVKVDFYGEYVSFSSKDN
jgi:replicative DNA helicase